MPKKDFKQKVAEVKTAYNIVEYIENSGITLKRAGTSKWKGLCPFHTEKTPSFIVDENFQNYRCFGCGANGDIIKFTEKVEHLDFMDVLKKLAEDKNIELEFDSEGKGVDYKSLRAVLRDTANFYVSNFIKLGNDHPAKEEVLKRGLSLNKNYYGYAPEYRKSLYEFLKKRGYSDDIMVEAGVVTRFENGSISDFWNGRLIFIITDIRGRPIGFSGRKLYDGDTRGKYVNSKDGIIFDKSNSLYNLNKARETAAKSNEIFISEGQFDVSAFMEAGILNVVASSGTAFTNQQALICRRIVGEEGRIVFAFDGDEAGKKAVLTAFKNSPLIHAQSFVVTFPEGTDPSDYRQRYGNEEFVKFIKEQEVPMIQYVLEQASLNYDLDTELGRNNFILKAVDILSQIPSQSLKEVYMKRVALMAFVSLDVIRNAVLKTPTPKQEVVKTLEEEEQAEFSNPTIERIRTDRMYDLYARLLRLSISNPSLITKLDKLVKFFPKDLKRLAYEITQVSAPFLPEKFTDSEIVEYLVLQEDWFPLSYLMNEEEITLHLMFLYNQIVKLRKTRREEFVRRRISAGLGKTGKEEVELLSYALEREKKEIQRLKELELRELSSDINI